MFIPTLESLSERIRCLEILIDAKIYDSEKALKIAHDNMNQRLGTMNEIREQLNEQAGSFMTRVEVNANFKEIKTIIDMIEKRLQGVELLKADIQGRLWTLGIVITILIVIMELIMHFIFKANIKHF